MGFLRPTPVREGWGCPKPLKVTFAGTPSGGTLPYTYAWDFDGDSVFDSTKEDPGDVYFSPGVYTVTFYVWDDEWTSANTEPGDHWNYATVEIHAWGIASELALDVKGAIQRFRGAGVFAHVRADCKVIPGLGLTNEDLDVDWGDNYIDVRSIKRGDARVKCTVCRGAYECYSCTTEKKWGHIYDTDLLAEAINIQVGGTLNIVDRVYAEFLQTGDPGVFVNTAGHAVVHWFLLKDTEENQEDLINAVTKLFGAGNVNIAADGMSGEACGTYPKELIPWVELDALDDASNTYFDDIWATFPGEGSRATDPDPNVDATFYDFSGTPTYVKTMTADDEPDDIRGTTGVVIRNDGTGREDIIAVVLVEYPWDYHGENAICVEWVKIGIPQPLAEAEFTITGLIISPTEVYPSEQVNISAKVTNVEDAEGTYTVTLKAEGLIEQTEQVTLSSEASQSVTFTVVKHQPGIYQVEIDGLQGSFAVEEQVIPWISRYRWLIGGMIAAVIAVAVVIWLTVIRRRRRA